MIIARLQNFFRKPLLILTKSCCAETKPDFIKKNLTPESRKQPGTWSIVSHPQPKKITQDPERLNQYFTSLASNLCGKENIAFNEPTFSNNYQNHNVTVASLSSALPMTRYAKSFSTPERLLEWL